MPSTLAPDVDQSAQATGSPAEISLTIGRKPRPPDLDANGQPVTGTSARPPDLDANGQPVSSVSALDLLKAAAQGAVDQVNPLPLLKSAYDLYGGESTKAAEALQAGDIGESLKHAAIGATAFPRAMVNVVGGIAQAHLDQAQKAWNSAFNQGDYLGAVGHVAAALVPVLGPAAANLGDELGAAIGTNDPLAIAHAAGGVLALLTPAVLKYATESVRTGSATLPLKASVNPSAATQVGRVPPLSASVPGVLANPNPSEVGAVDFGLSRGVPIDAGTATGNAMVKGVQHLADRSLAGGVVARGAAQAQADALGRVGGDLAAEAYPTATTPERAGGAVARALHDQVARHTAAANLAYDTLRDVEQQPGSQMAMPLKPQAVDALAEGQVGQLRRIVHELDAAPYNPATWVDQSGMPGPNRGNAGGGQWEKTPASGGAKVFDDIVQRMPGTSTPTRAVVQNQLEAYIAGGPETTAVKAALEVAQARSKGQGGGAVSRPELPPSAMEVPTRLEASRVTSEQMGLPVDLSGPKAALRPLYAQMKRQMPITQQQASHGLKAIENILTGPDFGPLSQIDRDLSAIKSVARAHGGLAKMAVSRLEAAVSAAAKNGGPDVEAALARGRAATKAKYAVADVLEQLREEPVQTFRRLTAPKDANIELLREIQRHAPGVLAELGRAWLEDALAGSTAEGGFDRAAGLAQKWRALGPETKRLLFGSLRTDLDHFFLLAKKIGETPNPSGTAHVVALSTQGGALGTAAVLTVTMPHVGGPMLMTEGAIQISAGVLAKMLRSPKVVQLLTRGLTLRARGPSPLAATTATGIISAARHAGLSAVAARQSGSSPEASGPRDQRSPVANRIGR